MNSRVAASCVIAVMSLTACGGGSSAAAGPTTPATQSVTAVLTDAGTLNSLFNAGHAFCTSLNVVELINSGTKPPPIKVTLRDAKWTIVGTKQLPKTGGTMASRGCTWPTDFPDVPTSNFYEATVTEGSDQLGKDHGPSGSPVKVSLD